MYKTIFFSKAAKESERVMKEIRSEQQRLQRGIYLIIYRNHFPGNPNNISRNLCTCFPLEGHILRMIFC